MWYGNAYSSCLSAHGNNGYLSTCVHTQAGKVDLEAALEHFQSAAEEGNPSAQYGLGYMYLVGEGVDQDQDKALKLFTSVSQSGTSLPDSAQVMPKHIADKQQSTAAKMGPCLRWLESPGLRLMNLFPGQTWEEMVD
jgi:TPR repeat protein